MMKKKKKIGRIGREQEEYTIRQFGLTHYNSCSVLDISVQHRDHYRCQKGRYTPDLFRSCLHNQTAEEGAQLLSWAQLK